MLAKKRRDYPPVNIKDMQGNTVPFVFNSGLTHNGATTDYSYNPKPTMQPYGFFIVPLSAGVIEVQLFGQEDDESFVIGAPEVTVSSGRQLPYRIKKVISSGTTVTSMQIVW